MALADMDLSLAKGSIYDPIFTAESVTTTHDVPGRVPPIEEIEREYARNSEVLTTWMQTFLKKQYMTVADIWADIAKQHANRVCLREVVSDRAPTYTDVDMLSNQMARWTRSIPKPFKAGDICILMMENSIEFILTWIGLCKAGVVCALINTNLQHEALAHAVSVANSDTAIVCVRYAEQWEEALPSIRDKGVRNLRTFWSAGHNNSTANLPPICSPLIDATVASMPSDPIPRSWREGNTLFDPLFYIYTSGTTGASKAVRMPHITWFGCCASFGLRMRLKPGDVFYNSLPYYHSAASFVCQPGCFYTGCTMVIREKFSPRAFWKDVQKFKCTAMIHIGELWRYLYNQEPCPEEKNNTMRAIVGNGLRADIWPKIVERFQISRVAEFYGQSEQPRGAQRAGGMMNCYGVPGAVGFIPNSLRDDTPLNDDILIQYDVDRDKVTRHYDPNQNIAVCKRVPRGTPGLLVYPVDKTLHSSGQIYTSKAASQKPMLEDVFEKGDLYYATGDLITVDENGFIFFIDRVGDTFRWKGENVSTNEVCAAVQSFEGVAEGNVYGVKVPRADGRAGMASIVMKPGHDFDVKKFHEHISEQLPAYARPVFLRLQGKEVSKTSTFKFQKFHYTKQGFNPDGVDGDQVWYSKRGGPYDVVTRQVYYQIGDGKIQSKL